MINGKTRLVGLLGEPVSHSISPIIHNKAFSEMNLDWCYIAMPCDSKNIDQILKALFEIDCQGLNITIPHKEVVKENCIELSPLAKKIGAVNTLIRHKEQGWFGENTDIKGFLEPLKDKDIEGKNAILIGTGGSAKAVFTGLQERNPAKIIVIGRSTNSLNKFSKNIYINQENNSTVKIIQQDDASIPRHIQEASIIINATPVGMHKKNNRKPLESEEIIPLGRNIWNNLSNKTILYDLIYNPKPTEWLKIGIDNGLETINGLEMLVQQGAASLRLWSNIQDVPIKKMRLAAENFLQKQ